MEVNKYIFFLTALGFLLFSNVFAEPRQMQYEISESTSIVQQRQCLHVDLVTRLDGAGKGDFYVPHMVTNFVYIFSKEGKKHYAENSRIFSVIDKPFGPVQFSYDVCANTPSRDLRATIIEKEYIFLDFLNIFLLPTNNINWYEKWNIEVSFEKLPEYFNFYSNYAINQKKIKTIDILPNFVTAAAWATKNKPVSFFINDKKIDFLYIGNDEKKSIKLQTITQKLITEQRKFWQDDDFEKYTSVFLDNKLHRIPTDQGGVRGRSFWQLSSCIVDDIKKKKAEIVQTISHELFHAWLGGKIRFSAPPHDLIWFSEGFTDYYAQKLARQAGLISDQEFNTIFNEKLTAYIQLPIKDAKMNEILSPLANDGLYYGVNLLRGYFIAARLDQLRDEKGQPVMPFVFKEIMNTYQHQSGQNLLISKKIVDSVFRKYFSAEECQLINNIVIDGKIIDFSREFTLGKKVKLKKMKLPEQGFDMRMLISKKMIANIDPNSPAYRAGLRNEMKVFDYTITFLTPDTESEIKVMTKEGELQVIKYKPESKSVEVPQLY